MVVATQVCRSNDPTIQRPPTLRQGTIQRSGMWMHAYVVLHGQTVNTVGERCCMVPEVRAALGTLQLLMSDNRVRCGTRLIASDKGETGARDASPDTTAVHHRSVVV